MMFQKVGKMISTNVRANAKQQKTIKKETCCCNKFVQDVP